MHFIHGKSKRYTEKSKRHTAQAKGPREKKLTHGKAYAKARPRWQKAHTYSKHWQQGWGSIGFSKLEALLFDSFAFGRVVL